jgi:hypothetical protein
MVLFLGPRKKIAVPMADLVSDWDDTIVYQAVSAVGKTCLAMAKQGICHLPGWRANKPEKKRLCRRVV